MLNGISIFATTSYANAFAANQAESPDHPPKSPQKESSGEEKQAPPIRPNPPQKSCCDGYSIESILDQAREWGLSKNPEVRRLEKYPCITCSELESIADELAAIAPEQTDEEILAQRRSDLGSVSEFAKDLERAEEEGRSLSRNQDASPSHSKEVRSPAQ